MPYHGANTAVLEETAHPRLLPEQRQESPSETLAQNAAPQASGADLAARARDFYGDYASLFLRGIGNVEVFVERYAISELGELLVTFRHPIDGSLRIDGLDRTRNIREAPEANADNVIDHADGSFTIACEQ